MEDDYLQQSTTIVGKELVTLLSIAAINSTTFPIEMVRTRLQTTSELIRQGMIDEPYKGVIDCVKKVIKNEGITAFWKGNFANILRVIPNETFNFFAKESIQIWVKKHNLASDNNPSLNFVSGSIGAVFTLAFIYPMDYARARLTNDIGGKGSITSYLIQTYKKQGLKGVYRGSLTFFVSAAIFRALYFGVFDTFKKRDPKNIKYRLIGAYVGSIIAIYAVYPFDTVRKRLMMTSGQDYKYGGFMNCVKYIVKNEGFKALFKGWPLSIGQGFGAAGCLYLFDIISTDVKRKTGFQ